MKKPVSFVLFALLLCNALYARAQTLTFQNLITLHKSGVSEMNRLLVPKGWVFMGELTNVFSEGCEQPGVHWLVSPSNYDETTKHSRADARLEVFYKLSNDCKKTVSYQTESLATYNSIIKAIRTNKMSLIETQTTPKSGPYNAGILEIYRGANFTCESIVVGYTFKNGRTSNSYIFRIYRNQ